MRKIIFLTLFLLFQISSIVHAMHISEGFLPIKWAIFYFVISFPVIFLGMKRVIEISNKEKDSKLLLALCGAFIFLLSALKLPSVTGSCSHPTGVGLSAIVFGPLVTSVLSMLVLLFQAIFLAHGGLTTLGANTFSMGIVGPFVSFLIYKFLKDKNKKLSVFLAAALGDLSTYVITSIQLALAFPSNNGGFFASLVKFLGIFALTQIPLAVVEGIFTVIIFDYLFENTRQSFKLWGEKQ
ncbi:Substrate-specific component CbiM of cobalt ECF transporter [Caloramator australicus RC3]|jgi:cobalt/nickel transport system permease protein|uniref:Cobalt transport protein CbiM n=2 Tax=Clostridiaceae TaxID=31979 RepID=I7LHB9_9CLOT|nr:Substrate-specific component CbiM of cobalt ECF transporter [Caloramator australicus RC3]